MQHCICILPHVLAMSGSRKGRAQPVLVKGQLDPSMQPHPAAPLLVTRICAHVRAAGPHHRDCPEEQFKHVPCTPCPLTLDLPSPQICVHPHVRPPSPHQNCPKTPLSIIHFQPSPPSQIRVHPHVRPPWPHHQDGWHGHQQIHRAAEPRAQRRGAGCSGGGGVGGGRRCSKVALPPHAPPQRPAGAPLSGFPAGWLEWLAGFGGICMDGCAAPCAQWQAAGCWSGHGAVAAAASRLNVCICCAASDSCAVSNSFLCPVTACLMHMPCPVSWPRMFAVALLSWACCSL